MPEPASRSNPWLVDVHDGACPADATFLLHYNPEVLAAPDVIEIQGQPLKITGHFIDPASEECADPASSESEQTVAYWDCAMKFVVDQLK